MTKVILATATVAHEAARTDVAMPVGTTVAGLMAMLRIDSTNPDLAITLADGSPAELDAVIGADLPSGTLLTVASGELTRRAQIKQADANDEAWLTTATATGATLTITSMIGIGLILAPLLIPAFNPGYLVRLCAGVIIALALITLALGGHATKLSAGPLIMPGLIGLAAMAPIDPSWPGATRVALAIGATVAALSSFVSWKFGRRTSSVTASLWGLLGAISLALAAMDATPAQVGATLISVGLSAVLLAPSFATAVPDSQLLDLPLLSTSVPDVRVPNPAKPTRITPRRIHATMSQAGATTDTVTTAGVAIAIIGGVTLATSLTVTTIPGLAALACLGTAIIGLALAPRGSRSAVTQVAPRIGAAVLLAATAIGMAAESLSAAITVGATFAVAFTVVSGTVATQRQQHSALLGRSGDILQGLCLGLLYPAAFVAAGAFGLIWQATS